MIRDNLQKISEKIKSVCIDCNRNPTDITLVGITKYADTDQVNEAIDAGLIHIGENRVQDAHIKFNALNNPQGVVKHMVGHLQTNKVKQALETFDLIESVDSLKLIREIHKQAAKKDKKVPVLIQLNISGEEQKFGIAISDVDPLLQAVKDFSNVEIQGLMTIAPMTEDRDVIRHCFSSLKKVYDQCASTYIAEENINFQYLSMGMSNDYDIAIEEGANIVRIGRAIFYGN